MRHTLIRFQADDVEVHAIRTVGASVRARLVLAHGAGAGMTHPFMETVAERLAARDVAVLRYDFPYMREGRRLPDRAPKLLPVVRAAVAAEIEVAGRGGENAPLWAGGKTMGGRMTSMAEAESPLGIEGTTVLGFPLHPAGRPSIDRAEHLRSTAVPLRFVSGTRDALATQGLLERVVSELAPRAHLHPIDAADHAFHVPKRSGRSDDDVLDEIASTVAAWLT